MKIRTLIVDDEGPARARIRQLLKNESDFEVVGECANGRQAVGAIQKQRPDLLFLDVQMPRLSGFEVCAAITDVPMPLVIFVTAYDQYALAAFDRGAVDYVMKPFAPARLALAVARIRERMHSAPADLERILQTLAEGHWPARQFLRWISVAQGRTVQLITVDQICYFQADNKYTIVVTAAAQSLINKTIKDLVDELDPDLFLQIHRGTVVNVNAIAAVHRDLRGRLEVHLEQRSEILQVSASFAHLFKQM